MKKVLLGAFLASLVWCWWWLGQGIEALRNVDDWIDDPDPDDDHVIVFDQDDDEDWDEYD